MTWCLAQLQGGGVRRVTSLRGVWWKQAHMGMRWVLALYSSPTILHSISYSLLLQYYNLEMDKEWVSVLFLISAACGVSPYVPHRYHFVNEGKTWTEAQSYCRQTYTDLATINNMEEMKKLNDTLKDKASSIVWIGLDTGNTREWLWSLADEPFYREGESYQYWNNGEPNNADGKQYCAAMMHDTGTWNDETCVQSFTFVCFDKNKNNTDRYMFINETKSWCDAQRYCREHYTDLTSVRNQTENQQIWNLAKHSISICVWIGLFNDLWKWSDKSISSFRYWRSRQPDNQDGNNCAAVSMTDQGQWHSLNCGTMNPFICHENQLILINETLTWREALRYCEDHHVDLVSVHSEEIQLWVKEVAQNASTEHVWLGLRHTCTLSFWFWVSGEAICYQNWAPGNGTGGEDCRSGERTERTGAVQSRGGQQWVSLPEDHKLNFICTTY
ncbi:hypothetical protein AOLI_G00243540 [Acnodon oligacanthus]